MRNQYLSASGLLLIWGERVLAGEKPWLYRPDMVAAGWRGRERELGKKERGGDREGFFLFLPTSGWRVMIEREREERERLGWGTHSQTTTQEKWWWGCGRKGFAPCFCGCCCIKGD